MASSSSSSSSFFDIEPLHSSETSRHTLNACSLCGKRLAEDCDIFMYRGDTPFCSEDCRWHQILRDEQASAKGSKYVEDHLTSGEQHGHSQQAESDRVKIAADVPVAT